MSLPTPDAQSPEFLSRQLHSIPSTHSMPVTSSILPQHQQPLSPITPPPFTPTAEFSGRIVQNDAPDFSAHSRDLASAGLKTLTAKRELPPQLERRPTHKQPEATAAPRSYTYPLVILACIVIMLLSGGIVLFMLFQP